VSTTETIPNQSPRKQLEEFLELYLVKKAPALPPDIKEAIVKFGPWVILILMLMTLPLVLTFLGIGAALTPFSFAWGVSRGFSYLISMILSLIMLILQAIALPGLFKRSLKSWYLVFYSTLVYAVESALTFSLGGLIIGVPLSLYILFQIKEYYS
jgi:hypothetical protein